MKIYLRYVLLALLWSAVAAYMIYASAVSGHLRASRKVVRMEIGLVDSTSQGCLVSGPNVRKWISESGIPTIGTAVDAVDLTGIERLIARNGFVDRVKAYVSYGGTLHISICQRKPLLRLLTDGFDAYVTDAGYVFAAPRASSLYVPVVTGAYRPPFHANFAGEVRMQVDERIRKIDRRIEVLEREKYPFYKRELQNDRNMADLRRMRTKRRWWRLESVREFERRVAELRAHKTRLRRRYRYEARLIQEGIDRLAEQQQEERRRQKKLEKSYEDFMKLLTFVRFVEEDGFWRSEVVQIVARTAPSGALEVDLVPRSGSYTIRFGRLEGIERKFDKLLRFYEKGLAHIGWEEYRIIDIRYEDQVVCKK